MFSCRFLLSSDSLGALNECVEELEISNISFFENTASGFSKDLDELGFPITKKYDIEILQETEKSAKSLQTILINKFPNSISNFEISLMNNLDWLDLYAMNTSPVVFEKFFFYGGENQKQIYHESLIPIKLNSALAFGSGHHETTKTCLANLLYLEKNIAQSPKNILDMGAGTGILGICAKKLWPEANLVGIDSDKEAIAVLTENYSTNSIYATVIHESNVNSLIASKQKFDVILCNILKQPLIDLCENFHKILDKQTGFIITAGYTKSQETDVENIYSQNKYKLINKTYLNNWVSILFQS